MKRVAFFLTSFIAMANSQADEPDYCIVGIDGTVAIGCLRESDLDTIASYKGDETAARKIMLLAVASGTCKSFNDGELVYIVDYAIFSERRKVRSPGSLEAYWMPKIWTKPKAECAKPHSPNQQANHPMRVEDMPGWKPHALAVDPAPQAAPKPRAKPIEPDKPNCVFKTVMTDDEIQACR